MSRRVTGKTRPDTLHQDEPSERAKRSLTTATSLNDDLGYTVTFNNVCSIVLTSRRRHELLTLVEESFSTFSHGTCSLSVSWSYLVLDGVYHLIQAALSSNPTLEISARRHSQSPHSRGYHPLWPSGRESIDT